MVCVRIDVTANLPNCEAVGRLSYFMLLSLPKLVLKSMNQE